MTDSEKKELFEKYNNKTHIFGRTVSVISLILLIGASFLMGMF